MEIFDVLIFLVGFCQKHKFSCNYFCQKNIWAAVLGRQIPILGLGEDAFIEQMFVKKSVLNTVDIWKYRVNWKMKKIENLLSLLKWNQVAGRMPFCSSFADTWYILTHLQRILAKRGVVFEQLWKQCWWFEIVKLLKENLPAGRVKDKPEVKGNRIRIFL